MFLSRVDYSTWKGDGGSHIALPRFLRRAVLECALETGLDDNTQEIDDPLRHRLRSVAANAGVPTDPLSRAAS
jgi:hypothetical protein